LEVEHDQPRRPPSRQTGSPVSAACARPAGRRIVASHFPHLGEENCLRGRTGSGTIFFSRCKL
jgi:uncharacterized Fe-S radical SAM superfamily protein PflX